MMQLSTPPIDPSQIEELVRKLESDNLVLFIGAGISHQAKPYDKSTKRLPLWRELAAEVGRLCGDDIKNYDGKLLDLFDAIVSCKDRATLEEAVRRAIPENDFEPTDVHKTIVRLPWHITYTTNYDNLLSRALGKEDFVSNEKEYEWLRRSKKPRLIHLHGTLKDPRTLSGTDYRSWATKNPIAHEQLIRPMPGLDDTIKELRAKGIGLYIVSGNVREIIRIVLGEQFVFFDEIKANDMIFDGDGLIKEIRGHDFDFEGKADFLRRVFKERRCDPLDVLFVGNSLNDNWAIRSGARTLCVNPSETDPYDRRVWNYSLRPMENLIEILPFVEGNPPTD